jgi:hypothetical protein
MEIIFRIHSIFGEMVLPLLIVIAAIWFTVAWKPGVRPERPARLFPILVDIQFVLGLIWWIYGIVAGFGIAAGYLAFPFILHPILGFVSVILAHMSVNPKSKISVLGRWAPLATMALLLVSILGGVVIARTVA